MASDIEKEFFGYDANGKPIEGEFRRSPFYTNPRIVALAMHFTGWLTKDRFREKFCPLSALCLTQECAATKDRVFAHPFKDAKEICDKIGDLSHTRRTVDLLVVKLDNLDCIDRIQVVSGSLEYDTRASVAYSDERETTYTIMNVRFTPDYGQTDDAAMKKYRDILSDCFEPIVGAGDEQVSPFVIADCELGIIGQATLTDLPPSEDTRADDSQEANCFS